MTTAKQAMMPAKPILHLDYILHLEELIADLVSTLHEFVSDVDAVGVQQVGKEWPDLIVSYNKARAALAKVDP